MKPRPGVQGGLPRLSPLTPRTAFPLFVLLLRLGVLGELVKLFSFLRFSPSETSGSGVLENV